MQTNIIKIGNSKGLTLSKTILDRYKITDVVNIKFEKDHIIIEAVKKPRANWEVKMSKMSKNGDDNLLIPDTIIDENIPEWK